MNIVIIEDEKPAARLLARELKSLGYEVSHTLYSVSESLTWFAQGPEVDLIFADIELADGLSLEIFEQLPIQSAIIFVTSYDHYAIKAFKLNSIDYLLKPIDPKELQLAIDKFTTQNQSVQQAIKSIRESLGSNSYAKRLMVNVAMQIKMILVQDIVSCYRMDRGIYIQDNKGYNHLLEQGSLESVLASLDPTKFFRINRHQIIAIEYIDKITQYSGYRLEIVMCKSKEAMVVSRERVTEFKKWLSTN